MPDVRELPDLPDLVADVRDRVVVPPYDDVARRVRARRRRTAIGTIAVAVLAVGGVAVWQEATPTAGHEPAPAHQTPVPPTDASQWRAVVDGTQAHVFEISGTDDGSVAVVWRALEQPAPTFALVIREADGTVHGVRLDGVVSLTPVPGGWVGVRGVTRGWFIDGAGRWTSLGDPAAPRQPRPGDVYVHGSDAGWLFSPGDRSWSVMPNPNLEAADGYITPGGDLATCGALLGRVSLLVGDVPQGPVLAGDTCVLAGRGEAVAMAALGDGADGGIPLTGLLVSTDEGPAVPRVRYPDLNGVTSLVVTRDGSTLVTGVEGRAVMFRRDGATLVEPGPALGVALAAGDRLYALSYGQSKGPLLFSDDDGATWQETTLPGMGSSED